MIFRYHLWFSRYRHRKGCGQGTPSNTHGMLLKICKNDNMIFAWPNQVELCSAFDCASFPHRKKINSTTNNATNIATKGVAATTIDAPSAHSTQSVPCLTNPSAQTKHNGPLNPSVHWSSKAKARVVFVLLLLSCMAFRAQMELLVAGSMGQHRALANSWAFNALYPATQGEKISLSRPGRQNPGLAVSSERWSPSSAEQSAPFSQGTQSP